MVARTGAATYAELNMAAPANAIGTVIAVDPSGNLYIADCNNYRVRKVSNGVITTVAGNGISGFSGDNGPATSAQLGFPAGVGVDAAGRASRRAEWPQVNWLRGKSPGSYC